MLAGVSDRVPEQIRGGGNITVNEAVGSMAIAPSDEVAGPLLRDRIAEPDPVAEQPLERLECREPGQSRRGAGDIAGKDESAQRHWVNVPGLGPRQNLAN